MLTVAKYFSDDNYSVTTTKGYYSIFKAEDAVFTSKEDLLRLSKESISNYNNFDYLTYFISAWDNEELDEKTDQMSLLNLLKRGDEIENYEYYHSELRDMVTKEKKRIESHTTFNIAALVDAVKICPQDCLLFFYLNWHIYLALSKLL
jgi:hypothetical protein